MTELQKINKAIDDLYSIRDVALSVFGDEGYFALDDSIRSLQKTWNICKEGQEKKLNGAYKTPVSNSRKPVNSSLRKEDMELYLQYRDDLFHAINEVDKKYNMSGSGPLATKEDFDEVVEWMNVHDYWAEPEEYLDSSRKPIKSSSDRHDELTKVLKAYLNKMGYEDIEGGVDAAADYILQNEDYYDDYDLHLKAKKWFNDTIENYPEDLVPLNSSKKPIKSSLEDRLTPYLEEFEEGYADAINKDAWNEDTDNVNQDTFFEIFMSDHNLTRSDIENLKNAVGDIWDETDEEIEHDMGEMYGVPHGASSEEALKHFE